MWSRKQSGPRIIGYPNACDIASGNFPCSSGKHDNQSIQRKRKKFKGSIDFQRVDPWNIPKDSDEGDHTSCLTLPYHNCFLQGVEKHP